jgi:hypothetical protein
MERSVEVVVCACVCVCLAWGCDRSSPAPEADPSEPSGASTGAPAEAAEESGSEEAGAEEGEVFEVEGEGVSFVCPPGAPRRLCEQTATPRFGGYTLPVTVASMGPMDATELEAGAIQFAKLMGEVGGEGVERDGIDVTFMRGPQRVRARAYAVGERVYLCQIMSKGSGEEVTKLEGFAEKMCASMKPVKGHEGRVSCAAAKEKCVTRCDAGDGWACVDLGVYLNGDEATRAQAKEPFEKGCDAGVADACESLAMGYKLGKYGKDRPKAKALYEKACGMGSTDGCNSLGWMQDADGELDAAIATFTKLCEADHAKSCSDLSARLMKKEPADEAGAARARKKACGLGWSPACR